MAENKKSFLLYADLLHTVSKMPSDKAGELFKHILRYVNDENPVTDDIIVELTFEPIKQQLKRDLQKYEGVRDTKSNSGVMGNLKRWNEDLYDKVMSKEISIDEAISIAKHRKTSQSIANVAVSVNDNDTVNVIVSEKESITPAPDLSKSNLYRQPVIPTLQDVQQAFLTSGGTKEMAQVFFDKNEATSWFSRGSPITNFRNLLPAFISNWNKNLENGKSKPTADEKWNARVDYANRHRGASTPGATDP